MKWVVWNAVKAHQAVATDAASFAKCEVLPGVAYPGVRDNRSTINTKTGYDDDDELRHVHQHPYSLQMSKTSRL